LDWKSGGDTNFAPLASATGEMDCRGFWDHGKPDKDGIWTANLELRVPLFGSEDYRLVDLRFLPTELAAFLDVGTAWSSHSSPVLRFAIHSTERIPVASAGVAARVVVGGLAVVQLYVAKPIQRPQKGAVTGVVISPGW